jgi:hypothetical protein
MDKIQFILDNLPDMYNKESDSNIYAILNSIGTELDVFLKQADEVRNAKFVDYAKDSDLDRLAKIINMKRFVNETDDAFRGRIKSRVPSFVGGGAISALKQVVVNYLGVEPIIIEHYKSGEGHPYFDNGVLNGLSLSSINSTNVKISSGIAYVKGNRYSLNEANQVIAVGNQYLKYNLFTDTDKNISNFEGKIAGSIVENSNIIKRGSSNVLPAPSSFTIELTDSQYSQTRTLDGTLFVQSHVANGAMDEMLFSFNLIQEIERKIGKIPGSDTASKVAWLKTNVSKLVANWYGWGTTILSNPTGTTDFVGKVSGSVTENANIAKWNSGQATLQTPTGAWNEDTTANYTSINSQNGSSFQTATTAGTTGLQAQHMFSFDLIAYVKKKYGIDVPGADTASKVTWLKANISAITCNWYGYGSSPTGNKAYLSVWRTNGNVWYSNPVSHTLNSISKLSLTWVDNNSMDSNGFVHFLAYSDPSNGTVASNIYTDYISLDVTMKSGSNKATFNVWDGTWTYYPESHTSGSVTKLSRSITTSIPNAIQSDGFVHYIAYADASNGLYPSTIYTDYVELEIYMKNNTYITVETDNTVKSNQALIGLANGTSITDMRNILDPENHYITNTASITVQIPFNFTSSNIPLEDVKDILRNTKAAGIALLIKIMETYNDYIQLTENAHSYFLMGFSGIGGNNILGGQ